MAASDANLLIASGTHSSALGIVVGFSFSYDPTFLELPGEGVTGSTAAGMYRSRFVVTLTFLVGPPRPPNGALASLVIVVKKMDGTTSVTYTITSMKAGRYALNFDRSNPPAQWTQEFFNVSDMATDPQTQA